MGNFMKQIFFLHIFFLLIVLSDFLHAEGFVAETLIHTERGLIPIEQCKINDCIYVNKTNDFCRITHIDSCFSSHQIKLSVGYEEIGMKVTKNIEDCDGFKKGDYVVIDAMHKDHLEVFDKRGGWVRVANFDGAKNHEKTKQGEKESRVPLR
jgi:hypothetical protein